MTAKAFLLVSGSLRMASSNTAILQSAVRVAPEGVKCQIYDGLSDLPAFNPDDDRSPLHPEVERLRSAIHSVDAIVFSTPEYAGALPGSFKNLLDWTIGDDQSGSIYDKPVAWINASPRGADGALSELRIVLTYANARIIEAACTSVPITATMMGADGLIHDEGSLALLTEAFVALAIAVK